MFYLHGSSIFVFFHVFFAFFVFLCFWGHLENSSFTCMGAQFWRTQSIIVRFFVFFGNVLKTGFRPPRFFTFFHHFGGLLGGLLGIFWRPFGISVVSSACRCRSFGYLWLACAVCGLSLLLFVVPLARPGCLWARGPLRGRFFIVFGTISGPFSE